jgi:hypothetical protein
MSEQVWNPGLEQSDLNRQRTAITWLRSIAGDLLQHGACNDCRRNAAEGLDRLGLLGELLAAHGLDDPRALDRSTEPESVHIDWPMRGGGDQ